MLPALIFPLIIAIVHCRAPISVRPDTLRLVDAYNREVVYHGVNVVVKGPPWIPDTDKFSVNDSFSTEDMKMLQQLGLNAIRLGTMWPGAEPQNGTFNMTYINALRDLASKAATYGIYSLLDMHQDVWSEKFCGEGVPLWAAIPNKSKPFPEPLAPAYNVSSQDIPLPSDCARIQWATYYTTAAAGSAFQNFYDNLYGLRDAWVRFWVTVAKVMAPLGDAILGYELMNEPWAGDVDSDPTLILPGVADRRNLQPTWDAAAAAIRAVDPSHAIFFEGVTWDWFRVGFSDIPGGQEWTNKSVLSYHFYIPPDFSAHTQFKGRMDDMKNLRCGGFLTEFSLDTPEAMDECDRYVQSWLMWEYKPFVHYKTGYASSVWNQNGSVNTAVASQLSRTYAQAIAGVTRLSYYDTASHSYVLIYDTDPIVFHNTTVVYFNEALHYPAGFTMNVMSSAPGGGGVSAKYIPPNRIEVTHDVNLLRRGTITFELFAK